MWEFFYYTKCIKTEAKHVKITQLFISLHLWRYKQTTRSREIKRDLGAVVKGKLSSWSSGMVEVNVRSVEPMWTLSVETNWLFCSSRVCSSAESRSASQLTYFPDKIKLRDFEKLAEHSARPLHFPPPQESPQHLRRSSGGHRGADCRHGVPFGVCWPPSHVFNANTKRVVVWESGRSPAVRATGASLLSLTSIGTLREVWKAVCAKKKKNTKQTWRITFPAKTNYGILYIKHCYEQFKNLNISYLK